MSITEWNEIEFHGSFETHRPDEAEEEVEQPGLNTPAELGRGIIMTDKNKSKEYTILLVGETGTGKTRLLSLLANIVLGHKPEQFYNFNDESNEAGGGQKHSQTNEAKVYKFMSVNGIGITILDTPGLADTRGLAQDERHKASIARAIKENICIVNAVIILANGTVPRLGVATDYALSTLSSIFPRTLADNIGILFTNVSSALSWNFDQNSLPDVLRNHDDNQWLLDNPLAMWNKYQQMKAQPKVSKKELSRLRNAVGEGYQRALEEISTIFDWLDGLEPQPTNDIMNLFEKSQHINRDIENAMSRAAQISDKRKKIAELKQKADGHGLTMKQYENFRSVITSKLWVQEDTSRHNTLCAEPNCYSNCHIKCRLFFSLSPSIIWFCSAIGGGNSCRQCNHSYNSHRHYHSEWKQQEHSQTKFDQEAYDKYNEAKKEKKEHETTIVDLDQVILDLDSELEQALISLRGLTDSYARLSLSGSFAGQVKKSVALLEANLEAMRNNGTDSKSTEMMEKSLESMRLKLRVVEEAANEKAWGNDGRPTKTMFSRFSNTRQMMLVS